MDRIFAIDSESCVECGQCRRYCPLKDAIKINAAYQHEIDADICSGCGLCEAFCPVPGALFVVQQDEIQSAEYLKSLRRVVWRGQWHFEDHPIMGPVTEQARQELRELQSA
jgi:MinD superfamily P-loop ATPase